MGKKYGLNEFIHIKFRNRKNEFMMLEVRWMSTLGGESEATGVLRKDKPSDNIWFLDHTGVHFVNFPQVQYLKFLHSCSHMYVIQAELPWSFDSTPKTFNLKAFQIWWFSDQGCLTGICKYFQIQKNLKNLKYFWSQEFQIRNSQLYSHLSVSTGDCLQTVSWISKFI